MSVYYGFTYDEYRAHAGLSASTCKAMATKPPAQVRYDLDNPKPSTDRLVLGTYSHALILEPHRLESAFLVVEKFERRSAEAKQRWAAIVAQAEQEGKVIVWDEKDHENRDTAMRMRDAIYACAEARDLLANGRPEVSLFAESEGVAIKSREDWMPQESALVIDLKTTADPTPDAFARSCYTYGYDIAQWHYRHVREMALPDGGRPEYRWLVVSIHQPHLVAIYAPSRDMDALGARRWRQGFEAWRDCLEFGQWPGLPPSAIEIDPPAWAMRGAS